MQGSKRSIVLLPSGAGVGRAFLSIANGKGRKGVAAKKKGKGGFEETCQQAKISSRAVVRRASPKICL